MKSSARIAILSLAAAACGDSPTGVEIDDIAGTWTAQHYVFTEVGGAGSEDLIAQGGSYTLTINPDGTYSSTLNEPGGGTETRSGTVTVIADNLTLSASGQGPAIAFTAFRDGDAMTLVATGQEYDFDSDGSNEDAELEINLMR